MVGSGKSLDFFSIRCAGGTDRSAATADRQALAVAAARTGDFLLFDRGAVGQHVIGVTNGKRLVQLRIEYPLLFLVDRVAGTQDFARHRVIELFGALVGLGYLVVEAPLHVIDQQAVEGEAMFDAEALTGDGVVAGAPLVHAAGQHAVGDGRSAVEVRATVGAFLIGVAIILVLS